MFRRINFFFWLISTFGSMAALYCLFLFEKQREELRSMAPQGTDLTSGKVWVPSLTATAGLKKPQPIADPDTTGW